MALAAGPEAQVGKLVIRNIGLLLSGRLEEPILGADTVVAEGGLTPGLRRARWRRADRQPRASGVRGLDAAARAGSTTMHGG